MLLQQLLQRVMEKVGIYTKEWEDYYLFLCVCVGDTVVKESLLLVLNHLEKEDGYYKSNNFRFSKPALYNERMVW